MAVVGSAEVILRAIGTKLEKDIQDAFNKAASSSATKRAGNTAGNNFSDGVADSIRKNTKINKAITDSTKKGAATAGDVAGTEISRRTSETVRRNSSRIGTELGDRVGSSAGKAFERSRFFRSLSSSVLKLGVLIPVVGVIVGGLSSLVSGLFAVGAALGTAAASSVSLLGAIGALGQGALVTLVAFNGLGDAISMGFKDPGSEEFLESLKKLTPEARSFVQQVVGMKDGLTEVRNAAQRGLLPGLGEALSRFETQLPSIAKGFEATGIAVGRMFSNMSVAFTRPVFLDNLATFAASNNTVILSLGGAIQNLTGGLVGLLAAAAPLTERMAASFAVWTANLRDSIEAGEESGKLTEYFNEAGDAAALVGDILGGFLEGLYEIGRIAQPTGIALLESFRGATDELANLTENAEKVQDIQKYFEGVEENVIAISGLVKDLGGAFLAMGDNPAIAETADALRDIVPELQAALETSIELGPALAEFIGELLELYTTLSESGAISTFVNVLESVTEGLNALLNIPGVGKTVGALLSILAVVKSIQLVAKLGGLAGGGLASMFTIPQTTVKKLNDHVDKQVAKNGFLARSYTNVGLSVATMAGSLGIPLGRATADTERLSRSVSAAGDTAERSSGVFSRLGSTAGTAATGFTRVLRTAAPAAGAVGLMALSATGAADSFGLSNTALFAGAGLLAGPWGAAIGAGIGLVADIASAHGNAARQAESFNEALNSGSLERVNQEYADIEKRLAGLQDIQQTDSIGDFLSDIGPSWKKFFEDGFTMDIKADTREAQDQLEQLQREKLLLESPTLLSIQLSVDKAFAEIEPFKAQLAEAGQSLTDLGNLASPASLQIRDFFQNLAATTSQLDQSTPAFANARTQLLALADQSLNNSVAADLYVASLLGIPPAIRDIPGQVETELIGDARQFLAELQLPEDVINELIASAQGITVDANTDPAKANLNQLLGLISGTTTATNVDGNPVPAQEALASLLGLVAGSTASTSIGGNPSAANNALAALLGYIPTTDASTNVNANTAPAYNQVATFPLPSRRVSVFVDFLRGSGSPNGPQPGGGVLRNDPQAATGGWIRGIGTSTSDSIRTWLSDGEFVVNAAAAAANGRLLEAINSGDPIPLPTAASVTGGSGISGGGGASSARIVSGELTLTPDGRAFIRGVAQDTIDENNSFNLAQGF